MWVTATSTRELRHVSELALPAAHPDDEITPAATRSVSAEVETLRRRLVRLAFDVHDGPMQGLTAVRFGLREVERALGELAAPVEHRDALATQIAELVTELATAEAGLRSLITTLEHGTPEIDRLETIVSDEIARFERRSDAAVQLVIDRDFQPDTHSQAIAIQSVLREALNNVVKHSNARLVQIRVQPSPTGILIEVTDDGDGFDPRVVRPGSIGIVSMKQRVELLGGEFDILSKPGGPTVVTALLLRWRRPSPDR
jgi:signal transduction histidine kinase